MFQPGWAPPDPFGANAPKLWAAVRDPFAIQKLIETSRPQPLPAGEDTCFGLPGDSAREIVIRTGDIQKVRNVDVIVSSENLDLQLARYYDPSVSGTLRYLDAARGPDGRVTTDSLNDALLDYIASKGMQLPVMSGTVVPVPSTGLRSAGVKYVFLAAAVRGDGVGRGYSSVVGGEVQNCVAECFRRFRETSESDPLESILFPVFGAGTAKQDPEEAVRTMLPTVLEGMRETPACKRAYVLAWVESHRRALMEVAAELSLVMK